MKKTVLISAAVALLISLTAIGMFIQFYVPDGQTYRLEPASAPARPTTYSTDAGANAFPEFTQTAEKVMDAVVHIRSTQTLEVAGRYDQQNLPDPFRDFFGGDLFRNFHFQGPDQGERGPEVRQGTGSGVILHSNGYIVTNNHVVADADEIEVTLHDNRTFKAKVVGTDPSTDLALLQIKADGLPSLPLVNSDDVRVGEWVLAVGNPFNLNSTVTAGIVSAKARNINILQEQYAVESFIQTDAAINPGNSGGALVNLQGSLVGINTAIASPTGAYSGYGFAIPANIVSKVVEDLLKYGVVQRGVLGVMIRSVDGNLAKDKDLSLTKGAYVDSLMANSAAAKAGVQAGDIIVAVDGEAVNSSPELQERIARHRPGDQVALTVDRKGKKKELTVTLNNREGGTALAAKEHRDLFEQLGADMQAIDEATAKKLDIAGGVQITQLHPGKLRKYTQMREGFIVTKVDGRAVKTVDELAKALKDKEGGVMLEGVYPDLPGVYYYAFGLGI